MHTKMLDCYQKVAHKQLRWLCVSPYLLISLLTAGISLPVAVNLVNNSSVQSNFNTNILFPSKQFKLVDLIRSYTPNIILSQLLGSKAAFKYKHSLDISTNKIFNGDFFYDPNNLKLETQTYKSSSKDALQVKTNYFFSINFYKNGSIAVFSSELFSFHPRVMFFILSLWLSHLFSIQSQY